MSFDDKDTDESTDVQTADPVPHDGALIASSDQQPHIISNTTASTPAPAAAPVAAQKPAPAQPKAQAPTPATKQVPAPQKAQPAPVQ